MRRIVVCSIRRIPVRENNLASANGQEGEPRLTSQFRRDGRAVRIRIRHISRRGLLVDIRRHEHRGGKVSLSWRRADGNRLAFTDHVVGRGAGTIAREFVRDPRQLGRVRAIDPDDCRVGIRLILRPKGSFAGVGSESFVVEIRFKVNKFRLQPGRVSILRGRYDYSKQIITLATAPWTAVSHPRARGNGKYRSSFMTRACTER